MRGRWGPIFKFEGVDVVIQDRVIAGALLSGLKQAVLQYTRASMEARAVEVRRTFERLAYDTARKHDQLLGIMELNRLSEPVYAVPAQDIQREAARGEEVRRSCMQFVRERLSASAGWQRPAFAPSGMQSMNAPAVSNASHPPEFMLPHDVPMDAGGSSAAATPQGSGQLEPDTKQPEPAAEATPGKQSSAKRGRKSSKAPAAFTMDYETETTTQP